MIHHRNLVAEAFERAVEPRRIPWALIVVVLAAFYFMGHFLPWAVARFPVAR